MTLTKTLFKACAFVAVCTGPAAAVTFHSLPYSSVTYPDLAHSWVDGKDLGTGQMGFTDVQLQSDARVTKFNWWGTGPSAFTQGFRMNIWGDDSHGGPSTQFNGAGVPNYGWLHQETVYDPLGAHSNFHYSDVGGGIYKYELTLQNPYTADHDGTYWFSLYAGLGSTSPSEQWGWAMSDRRYGMEDWREDFNSGYPNSDVSWSRYGADLASEVEGVAPVPEPSTFGLLALGAGVLVGGTRYQLWRSRKAKA